MHDGDHGQKQWVHGQRPNAVALLDSARQTVVLTLGVAAFGRNILGLDVEQQRHPVANELGAIVGVERLDVATREFTLQDRIARVRPDARRDDEAVVTISLDAILQQPADRGATGIGGNFIQSVEQKAAITRIEQCFHVVGRNGKVAGTQAVGDEFHKRAQPCLSRLLQEVGQVPAGQENRYGQGFGQTQLFHGDAGIARQERTAQHQCDVLQKRRLSAAGVADDHEL